jgi:hypothetical protein
LYLDLSGHALSGSLPALPPGLQFLNVSSNALSGSLPAFAVDAQLQYLDFSFNRWVWGVVCSSAPARQCSSCAPARAGQSLMLAPDMHTQV